MTVLVIRSGDKARSNQVPGHHVKPHMSRGWGFKIDYAAAIAEDERLIAALASPEAAAVSDFADTHPGSLDWIRGYNASLYVIASKTGVRERAAAVGVGDALDLACLLLYLDDAADEPWDGEGGFSEAFPRTETFGAAYRRGEAITMLLETIPTYPTAERNQLLAKAKASLSRHKRNQARYGT